MSLLTFGINHKTAPVDVRGRVAFAPDISKAALKNLIKTTKVKETALLSTCNRTEIYCWLEDAEFEDVFVWFKNFHSLDASDMKPYCYSHTNEGCVRHVLRVASGLDSMVLGEPQILGQMKDSYRNADDAGTLGKYLNRLFQHAFRVAKQVRTDTAIGSSPVSVAFAAVSLSKQIFGNISDKTVMLVGAGDTIELAARHLYEARIRHMIVANRSLDKAHKLAHQYKGYSTNLTEIVDHLHEADIVISSTASPLPVIGKGALESALKKRKHKPMFLVDIAVPRDIEPEADDLEDVFLYTVDDLHDVITQNMQTRQDAALQAEDIIDIQVKHFVDWLDSQRSITTIQNYRSQANEIRQALLDKAIRSLESGQDPINVVNILAHRLTNQLLHSPCTQLRQSTEDKQLELIKAATTLFDIKN